LERAVLERLGAEERPEGRWSQFVGARNTATLAAAAFLLTVAVMFMYRPFSQSEAGDSALMDYIAQSILRGQLPYRDVIDGKAPGSFYLSALTIEVGRTLGLSDVIAVRLLHIIMAGLLASVTFLVGEAYLKNRIAALLAVALVFTSDYFARWVVGGGQPKLPMILFGMLTLLLIAKDMPFWAGVCSMCSCLCWQPGLLFTGTAVVIFSRYFTSWRDLRAAKVLAGAAIPLLIVLAYFYQQGALSDLWAWTITYNYSVYAYQAVKESGGGLIHIWSVARRIFDVDIALVAISLIGILAFGAARMREWLRRDGVDKAADLYKDAIVIAPLAYSAFCLVRFNAGPYLIPFIPFIGLFAAWCLVDSWRLLVTRRFARENTFVAWLPKAALVVLASVFFYRVIAFQFESDMTLQDQQKRFEAVSRLLGPDDKLYVHGTTELLVLLNRPNLNPYVFLDWGKDDFIAARQGRDFNVMLDEIEAQAPKVVALSRLKKVAHAGELNEWVQKRYRLLEIPGYDEIYIRKQDSQ